MVWEKKGKEVRIVIWYVPRAICQRESFLDGYLGPYCITIALYQVAHSYLEMSNSNKSHIPLPSPQRNRDVKTRPPFWIYSLSFAQRTLCSCHLFTECHIFLKTPWLLPSLRQLKNWQSLQMTVTSFGEVTVNSNDLPSACHFYWRHFY